MKKNLMFTCISFFIIILFVFSEQLNAQEKKTAPVYFFQSRYADSYFSGKPTFEISSQFHYSTDENEFWKQSEALLKFGGYFSYPVLPKLEASLSIGHKSIKDTWSYSYDSIEYEDSFSDCGWVDVGLGMRYNVFTGECGSAAAGVKFKLPIGDEDIGAGRFRSKLWSGGRYESNWGTTFGANLGLNLLERSEFVLDGMTTKEEKKIDTRFGFTLGAIHPLTRDLHLVAEYGWRAPKDDFRDFSKVTLGVDLKNKLGNTRLAVGSNLGNEKSNFLARFSHIATF